ncbi:MAG: hypothetical protein MI922_09260 [Bacteroidales bacterium]|nr:hypothetical protein [Bacteroidales bacterium]
MNYKNLSQQERDDILKKELPNDIVKIINRYRLVSTYDFKWISQKENSHEHIIFTQKFLLKTDAIGALFRINYLCFAKVNYFRQHLHNFVPLAYHPSNGFVETELALSDFLKHKSSGIIIDYRFLQSITEIEEFHEFCKNLESQ